VGLTNRRWLALVARFGEHGATFTVVKNPLTRRAAEAVGTDELIDMLSGPTAIAFVQATGDPVAVEVYDALYFVAVSEHFRAAIERADAINAAEAHRSDLIGRIDLRVVGDGR